MAAKENKQTTAKKRSKEKNKERSCKKKKKKAKKKVRCSFEFFLPLIIRSLSSYYCDLFLFPLLDSSISSKLPYSSKSYIIYPQPHTFLSKSKFWLVSCGELLQEIFWFCLIRTEREYP